jgi:dipeptidyl aminopeptidase/acylaminoacyl peptidase
MKPEPVRLRQQRWTIDNIIATVGVDWAWGISRSLLGATCAEIHPDVMAAVNRIKKLADISREFSRVGAKSESLGRAAEAQGHFVTARDYYFSAANLYAASQWPIWEDDNRRNLELSEKKNASYGKYMEHAAHRITKIEIPFEGGYLPGYLHLPREPQGKLPCALAFDGMDGWKETYCSLYGDKFLERGMAVMTLDGPGQGESSIRGIKCTADNFPRAGKAAVDFLVSHPEIDPDKIAAWGISMGSFWVPQIAAYEGRLKAVAVGCVCHEPGMKTIFNEACPSFKARYMWMAGYEDEEKFDSFAQKLSLRGVAGKIKCPVFIAAGEDDELSPIQHTYDLYDEIQGPKKLLVFEGQRHGLLIPLVRAKIADWMRDRLDGKPMRSEIIRVDAAGVELTK